MDWLQKSLWKDPAILHNKVLEMCKNIWQNLKLHYECQENWNMESAAGGTTL